MVLRSLAALAVSLVLLVSCTNDDPDPILAPSVSPTPTSDEPSPTKTASEEPESPEEFIERWVDLSNDMQISGDTKAYLEISKDCRPCVSVATDVAGIYAADGFVDTRGWELIELDQGEKVEQHIDFDARVKSNPVTLKRSAGASLMKLPGGPIGIRFGLTLVDNRWTMTELAEVPL